MSIEILVGKDGRPSMKKVFGNMKSTNAKLVVRRRLAKRNKEWLRVYEGANVEKFRKEPTANLSLAGKKVIRWGNRIEAETSRDTIVYNKAEAIANATDKKLSRELFIKGKVRTPRLLTPETESTAGMYPIIARPSHHAKGKNFIILKTRDAFLSHYRTHAKDGWYYSEYINKDREFRVHCAHGKILAVMEKVRGGDSIAWNRAVTGEPFTRLTVENYPFSVCFQALKAVKTLGLDFAGVDVMMLNVKGKDGKTKGEGVVLEVNTSPTLNSSDFVSEQYAKYFDWLSRAEGRREHWDFTKFEKSESFAWKQFQLMDQTNPGKQAATGTPVASTSA